MKYNVWLANSKNPSIYDGGPFGITQEGLLYISWSNGKSPKYIFAKGEWARVEALDEPIVTPLAEPAPSPVVE